MPGTGPFPDDLGQRVLTLVQQGTHDARLSVHPEHLGEIHVHLRMDGNAAEVAFSSPHAPVRDALEQSLPRLRDMLGDAGLSLQQATVHHQQPQTSQQHSRSSHGDAGVPAGAADLLEEDLTPPVAAPRPAQGAIRLLDTFA